jgi:hypothetical protein
MTTYYLTNINENKPSADLTHLKNRGVNSIDNVEKICAAECYVEITKRCELETLNPIYPETVKRQFEKEIIRLHKQFLIGWFSTSQFCF